MIKLTNKLGQVIPAIGLGTFPFQGREMADIIKKAVNIGYRIFDTADDYRGEGGIGIAMSELQKEGICREELFIQTKISDNNAHDDEPLKGIYFNPNSQFMKRHSVEELVREKIATSLRELRTSYIDSLLIHYPFPEYMVEIWKVMIKLQKEGKVRYIGVSNFHERHIEKIISETGFCPQINEVYASPIGSKSKLLDYCKSHNCQFMTYSPLMDIRYNRIPEEKFISLMQKYNKSLAQIILRWNIERGCIPLPKSKNPKRLAENFDIFNYSLDSDEVDYISSLNRDYQYLVESKICPGL